MRVSSFNFIEYCEVLLGGLHSSNASVELYPKICEILYADKSTCIIFHFKKLYSERKGEYVPIFYFQLFRI